MGWVGRDLKDHLIPAPCLSAIKLLLGGNFGEFSFWGHVKRLDFQKAFFKRGSDSSQKKKNTPEVAGML